MVNYYCFPLGVNIKFHQHILSLPFTKNFILRLFFKILARTILILLGLVLLIWLLLQTEKVQNFIASKATTYLSRELKTEVKIKHVSFALFNRMDLNKILIRDRQKDTLLYAGALKVRITDWFFLKSTADLKYIGLEDAIINQTRSDSIWNYQFIVDYFSVPKSSDTSKGITLNIQKVDFKKVTFIKKDFWIGQNAVIKTGSMLLDAQKVDFITGDILINSVQLDKPYYSIYNYKGLKPPKKKPFKTVNDSAMYFNQAGIKVLVDKCNITNGFFAIQNGESKSVNNVFDGTNIRVSNIFGDISSFAFINDTVTARVDVKAVERSGFTVKQLKANFKLTPQIMQFSNLLIQTPQSRLTDYYAMRYKSFNSDFASYVTNVAMDLKLKNASINSDDIAYFAPSLKKWKQRLTGSVNFHGTVSDFKVNDLFLRNNTNTYVSGDLAMKGLPDVNRTTIKFSDAIVQTNSREISFIYPEINHITKPNLAALGNVRFAGNFTGTFKDFAAKGNFTSALGAMYADLSMNFTKSQPSYRGNLTTSRFDIGKFIGVNGLGNVSFTGDVEGYSFVLDKLNAKINGNFSSLEFNNYTYSNLKFNGTVEKSRFNGEFIADDPNFNFTSSVLVDLSGKIPTINVLGDLQNMNLKNLNFLKENVEVTGLFDLNYAGRNIDEFIGSAKILNASVLHNGLRLDFDSLSVNSYYDTEGDRVLSAESNEFDIMVKGEYNIMELPNNFQAFLSNYYPAYIKPPRKIPVNQQFVLTANTRNFDKYARVLDSNLTGLSNATIIGSINTVGARTFTLTADVPFIKYKNYKLEGAIINGRGTTDTLNVIGNIDRINIKDSLYFPNTQLSIISSHDHSVVKLATSANINLNKAELNADVFTLADGVRINFQPSAFVLNDKQWDLEKQGELVILKKFTSAHNVKFVQGFQEISFETEENAENTSNLVARLKDVDMGDFMPLFLRKPMIEGIANGNVYLRDFYGNFNAQADINASQFRMDNDSVGIVKLSADYSSRSGIVDFDVLSENEKYDFSASGMYNIKDSAGSPLNTTVQLKNAKINFINQFLGSLFSDITGLATGVITLRGNINAPVVTGKVLLRQGEITVNFTKVRYFIDSAIFNFREDAIDFGEFAITDSRGNAGLVTGVLYEKGFQDMRFDLNFSSDKLLLLDTKPLDNESFYGKIIGQASLSLKGPEDDMHMVISGEINDSSQIYIPTSDGGESTDANFIVFKKYGTAIEEIVASSESNLTIDVDVTANNKAQIDVILDELTGDIIKATGNGRLQIHMPANGDMTMKGRYNIEGGKYDFNFQSLVKKPFELMQGANSYIEWNGDPFDAQINIDALYTAKNVSLGSLVSSSGLNLGGTVQGYKGDIYVIAKLTGRLTQPDIRFRLDFPQGSPIKNDDNFNLFLSKLQSDDNEMLKQVTWLIVFGSFSPYGSISATSDLARNTGINTISQKIASEVNKLVSNFLFRLTGDKSLRFDIGTQTYSSATLFNNGTSGSNNALDRQSVNLKLNQSLLNGKLLITFGGDLDFNLTSSSAAQTGNFQWLPDISAQIILSKSGNLKAIVFNRSSLDVYGGAIGRRTRQGVSISYSMDIDSDKLYGDKPRTLKSQRKDIEFDPSTD